MFCICLLEEADFWLSNFRWYRKLWGGAWYLIYLDYFECGCWTRDKNYSEDINLIEVEKY